MNKQKEFFIIRITERETGKQSYVKTYKWKYGEVQIIDASTSTFSMDVIINTVPKWKNAKVWKTKKGVEKAMTTVSIAYLEKNTVIIEIVDMTRLVKLEKLEI